MESKKNLLRVTPQPHPIYDLNLPFSDYIQQCQKIIVNRRTDLHNHAEKIIDANSPFEWQPDKPNGNGVLLIHGLLDSPFIMRDLAKKLQEKGYLVRAILLPGHGTTPNDLLDVDLSEWIQAVRYGVASFKNTVKKLYAVGFSTGGSLILQHALEHNDISAAALFVPAIKIRSFLDFASNWHTFISHRWPRAQWFYCTEEVDYAKYRSIPFNAAYQVYRLTRLIKKLSKDHQATCPLFYGLSLSDSTVSSHATIEYFNQFINPKNQMLLYTKNKVEQSNPKVIVRNSVYPQMKIHDLSHIGFITSPDNLHYGKDGDYIYASRIDNPETVIFGPYNEAQNDFYDFLYRCKIIKIPRRRLTFNPDFDFLAEKMIQFFDENHLPAHTAAWISKGYNSSSAESC